MRSRGAKVPKAADVHVQVRKIQQTDTSISLRQVMTGLKRCRLAAVQAEEGESHRQAAIAGNGNVAQR